MTKKINSLFILFFLLFLNSCHMEEKEYYELSGIELDVFDLKIDSSSGDYYPVEYDLNEGNPYSLVTINFLFDFFDSTDVNCPLEPGCSGPRDSIVEIKFSDNLLSSGTINQEVGIPFIEHFNYHDTPYDGNKIQKNSESNDEKYKYLPRIDSIFNIKNIYNKGRENNFEIFHFDEFYFLEKSKLTDYIDNFGKPSLQIETNLRTVVSQ